MPRDRRAEPRYPARIAITLTSAGQEVLAYTENLSVSGAYLECGVALSYGQVVDLRLSVPTDPAPLRVRAEIRWVARGTEGEVLGFGVRFSGMRAREMRAWTKYIKALE